MLDGREARIEADARRIGDKRRKVRMGIKLKFEYQPAMDQAA